MLGKDLRAKYDDWWSDQLESWDEQQTDLAARLIAELIMRNIGSHYDNMLDIGCGDGLVTRHLAKLSDHVVACDLSLSALLKAKRWGVQGIVVDLDGPDPLPFAPGSFDLITMSEVIEHLLWPERGLQKVRSLLADCGVLAITTPNISYWRDRIHYMFGDIPVMINKDSQHIFVHNVYSFKALLEKTGFSISAVDVQPKESRKAKWIKVVFYVLEAAVRRRLDRMVKMNVSGYRTVLVCRRD